MHVSIYINGKNVLIPSQVGIASGPRCYYWLHTHNTTGVIHVETPLNRVLTLGNFLDIWQRYFSSLGTGFPSQFDQSGWTAYNSGRLYQGNFRQIPLTEHELITLAYSLIQPTTGQTSSSQLRSAL